MLATPDILYGWGQYRQPKRVEIATRLKIVGRIVYLGAVPSFFLSGGATNPCLAPA